MFLSWEAVSALAAVISALVVVGTVIIGVRQVRVAAQQVDALRRATQLEGTMTVFASLDSPELRSATEFVLNDLTNRIQDAAFRAEVPGLGLVDTAAHPETTVLRTFEDLGNYVKHGLVDGEVLLDSFAPVIIATWECLRGTGVIAIHRAARGDLLWENYERLYDAAVVWLDARSPSTLEKIRSSREAAAARTAGLEIGVA